MDQLYEAKYHLQERTNWWFESRRHIILNLLKADTKNSKILEVGCSGGILIHALGQIGFREVYGIDISAKAIELCKSKGIQNVFIMDGTKTGFGNDQFDTIIASDVLEHIEREEKALCEWRRLLKPGGKLIVFVPAFSFLWGKHDAANHHYRRYSKSQLIRVLKEAEFRIDRSSYWNFSLFFPTNVVRTVQRTILKDENKRGDQLLELNPLTNKLLFCLVKAENIALNAFNFPVGVSVFAIARKDKASSSPYLVPPQ